MNQFEMVEIASYGEIDKMNQFVFVRWKSVCNTVKQYLPRCENKVKISYFRVPCDICKTFFFFEDFPYMIEKFHLNDKIW